MSFGNKKEKKNGVGSANGCAKTRCMRFCAEGYEKDVNGCDTCECKKKMNCRPVRCRMYCANGWDKDANGCEICRCKKDSAPEKPKPDVMPGFSFKPKEEKTPQKGSSTGGKGSKGSAGSMDKFESVEKLADLAVEHGIIAHDQRSDKTAESHSEYADNMKVCLCY